MLEEILVEVFFLMKSRIGIQYIKMRDWIPMRQMKRSVIIIPFGFFWLPANLYNEAPIADREVLLAFPHF